MTTNTIINLIKQLSQKIVGFFEFKYEKKNKQRESKLNVFARITSISIFLIIYMVLQLANC